MNKLILLLFILLSYNSYSQQDPLFSSNGFTPMQNNPASFGSWNLISANLVGRSQWSHLSAGSGVVMFNFETVLSIGPSSNYDKGFHLPMGVSFYAERIAGYRTQNFRVPLSYPIKLKNTTLAIGYAPGFTRRDIDHFGFTAKQTYYDSDAGLFWYGDQFYAGYSVTHLLHGKVDVSLPEPAFHHYLEGGYRFKVGEHYVFPMTSFNYAGGFNGLTLMTYFQFKEDVFSIGAGYRFGSNFMLGASGRLGRFKLAYNLDIFPSVFGQVLTGHEVRLSYNIRKNDPKLQP